MTERNQVNKTVGAILRPYGRWQRLEHAHDRGWPDVAYTLLGVSGWAESKLIPTNGKCPEIFTLEQLMWGEAEVKAGGLWHLIGRRESAGEWWILDVEAARAWYEGVPNFAITLLSSERFPLAPALELLAPRERRTNIRMIER